MITEASLYGRNGKGIPIFFSSGNDGTAPIWPSSHPLGIAVNASSMCDERKNPSSCDGEDWEGNWGTGLHITAPGVQITTCDLTGSYGYESGNYTSTFNGTSSACPNAAAVMALVYSMQPDFLREQAVHIIASTAEKVGGYAYDSIGYHGSWCPEMGYGRVNAFDAIIAALIYQPYPVGISHDPLTLSPSFKLYPNPASNYLHLQFAQADATPHSIKIYDINGRLVKQASLAPWQNQLQLNLHDLSNGIYFCQLDTQQKQHQKIVVYK